MPHRAMPWRLASLLVSAWVPLGCCWDKPTHVLIARLAETLIPPAKNRQLKKLMESDLQDAATWAEWATEKFPAIEDIHFQPQTVDFTCSILHLDHEPTLCHGAVSVVGAVSGKSSSIGAGADDPHCLYSALRYMYEHFSHPLLLEHFGMPAIKVPELPKLKSHVPPELLSSSGHLRWLQGLIADMHEPLHWGMPSNDFGRNITVKYKNKKTTLYHLWESVLPGEVSKDYGLLLQEVKKTYEKRHDAWKHQLFPRNLKYWGEDLARKVCTIYEPLRIVPKDKSTHPYNDTKRELHKEFTVDSVLYGDWRLEVQTQLVLAAQRTAHVLLDVLEHRKHVLHHKDGRGRHHIKKWWHKQLLVNVGCAAGLVPLLLIVFCWHHNWSDGNAGKIGKSK